MRLTGHDLDVSADDPIVELAPGVAVLFPCMLNDPTSPSRMYIVEVARGRRVSFVGVIARPAPHRAPTIAELRRAAKRAA
jgi:hypothetical protein